VRYAALALAVLPVALGVLVLRRSAQHRVGWLLVAHGLSVGLLLGPWAGTGTGRAARVVDQLGQGSWVLLFVWLVLIAYLLPDGRLASPRWRLVVRAGLAGVVLFVVGAAGDRSGFEDAHHGSAPPLRWLPAPVSDVLGVAGLLLVVVFFFGSVPAVRSRLRAADEEDRIRLLWLVWGALTVPAALLVVWANHFLLGDHAAVAGAALAVVAVALPAAIGISVLRHRLFDIQVVLSRTLTYATLVVGILALYALLLLAAAALVGSGTPGGLLAVGVVAVAVHPAYAWLHRRTERWVYGYRVEPHRALRLLADRVDSAGDAALTGAITAVVAEALRVERVWLGGADGPETGADPQVVQTPLLHRGEQVGELVVELPPGRRLDHHDRALLRDLARYVAVLVRSQRQADALRGSRARLVASREEERRRLRRDLHDGVGPSLAALVLKLNALRSRADGPARDALQAEIEEEVRAAIVEIRRLVDDLRPPAIDEVGLLAATRQRAAALGGEVAFEVVGPAVLPPLPAAVEVAAFRIASEAMTNVVRHAGATRCRIVIEVDGAFSLTISDNGRGVGPAGTGGVGWTSMRERAAELGGTCTISSRPDGGVLVRAVLPLTPTVKDPAEAPA
jgi:signal transduction histidine kinase